MVSFLENVAFFLEEAKGLFIVSLLREYTIVCSCD